MPQLQSDNRLLAYHYHSLFVKCLKIHFRILLHNLLVLNFFYFHLSHYILFIHDYLINNIDYDSSYQAVGTYSIYGALIEKKCVCEGYAKAFKYLLNSVGYECELLQGTATNSSGQTENHAWNAVKLNGIWYEIDTTWDDPIIIRK